MKINEMKKIVKANIEALIENTAKSVEEDQLHMFERGEGAIHLARELGLLDKETANDYSNQLFNAFCGN